jgi:type II secretory ATPase GspE/PulE/Tfp pilus assembly ATPase PilB-like protein
MPTDPAIGQDPFWLGRQLVEAGAISEAQLASAKQLWRKNPGQTFAGVLETLGLDEPAHLAELVARRHGLPSASLSPATADRAAARLLAQPEARRKCLVPFKKADRRLHVAVADPAAYGPELARRDFPDYDVRLHVAPRGDIIGLIEEAWRPADAAEPGARDLFDRMLREAIADGATDLHLEPRDQSLDVRQRVDGRLVHQRFVEQALRESVVQAAKIAGRMDIAERRLPQDGQGSLAVGSRRYDLRFSCLPAANGEAVVVRILDEHTGVRTFEESGLFEDDIARLRGLLDLPHGLVYVTGPTGAGKTTLLYSMLNSLPPRELAELKIITLEEPVEIRQPRYFLQINVDERIGRSFGELLRHALRHDPDVLLIGETRDAGTAETTLRAALTGHLCFSTLHTNDALGAIGRLSDLGLDPLMVACALKGVIAQRLLRRPCPDCRVPHPRDGLLRDRFGPLLDAERLAADRIGFVEAVPGRSCPTCRGRGYRGRIAVVEVFPLGGLEGLTAERAAQGALLGELRSRGCRTLFEDGIRKAALGLTTVEEVYAGIEEPRSALATIPGSHDSPILPSHRGLHAR